MSAKRTPKKLPTKLKQIRQHLDYNLDEMAQALGHETISRRSRVHEWENGQKVPDLFSLLAYARLVGLTTDVLIDDGLDATLK